MRNKKVSTSKSGNEGVSRHRDKPSQIPKRTEAVSEQSDISVNRAEHDLEGKSGSEEQKIARGETIAERSEVA